MISFFKNSFSFEVYHRIKLINIINTAFSLNTYVWQKRKLKEETYGDSYKGGGHGIKWSKQNKSVYIEFEEKVWFFQPIRCLETQIKHEVFCQKG